MTLGCRATGRMRLRPRSELGMFGKKNDPSPRLRMAGQDFLATRKGPRLRYAGRYRTSSTGCVRAVSSPAADRDLRDTRVVDQNMRIVGVAANRAKAAATESCRERSSSTTMQSPPVIRIAAAGPPHWPRLRSSGRQRIPRRQTFWAMAPPMPQRMPTAGCCHPPPGMGQFGVAAIRLPFDVAPTTTATGLPLLFLRDFRSLNAPFSRCPSDNANPAGPRTCLALRRERPRARNPAQNRAAKPIS